MAKTQSEKLKVLAGLSWRFGERILAQMVTFVVSIVLARILAPSDYGAIALVMSFITIANVFVTSGFGNALIQKTDADDIDFSTMFFFNVGLSLLLYIFIWLAAPYAAAFYKMPILAPVLRVLGLKIPISGVNNIQQAFVSRNMLFKRFFFSTIIGTIGSAAVGIIMAVSGFGIWALVAQYLFNSFCDTMVLWFTVKWRPKAVFSVTRLKPMFRYGLNIILSNLLYNFCNELSNIIIGKVYSSQDLAYYSKGKQLPNLIVVNINTAISGVLFPVLSKHQEERERLLQMTRRSIKVSSYVLSPLLLGLMVTAKPVVRLLLTDKWLPCVPFLQLYCLFYLLQPMQTANLEAIKAIGRSDLYFRMEVIKRSVAIIVLLISVRYGVYAIAVGNVVASFIRSFVNATPNKKLLNYSYLEQLKDIGPAIILSSMMAGIVALTGRMCEALMITVLVQLILQIMVGFASYIALSLAFKLESFVYIKDTALHMITKRRK
ncbi:lipopolysaccharide biosynthesis protein [Bariatricus sp. HCP28S3_A7]|uniref:lipopolysaccharide biosynthesis protein n=1 Tax=Bariatricus sp. HCP28S3_A7 TaxID=3438894 RepID=UPI003F8A49A7